MTQLSPTGRCITCRIVCVVLLCAVTVSAACADDTGAPMQLDSLAALKSRMQARLDGLVNKYGVPGATAAVAMADGRVVAVAAGLADSENQVPMRPDHRMPAGSVGKTFVAATALGLARDGRLSLDDKIEKWLGDEPWFGDLPNGRELTLRHLLMHRGGLTDHVNDPRFVAQVREVLTKPGSDPDFAFKPAELVGFILKKKPLSPAGDGYRYTDTGYILVGMIIESAGGASYYEQLQSRLLRPLKLSMTVPADRRDLPDLACGHLVPNNPLGLPETTVADCKLRFNPANEWTGGGLVSNPQDLVRWAKLLYEGKAMREPYLDELLRTALQDHEKKIRYGLGVFVTDDPKLGTSYGHGGYFPGYLTRMAYYPKQRVAIACQFNTDHPKEGALEALSQMTADVLQTADKAD